MFEHFTTETLVTRGDRARSFDTIQHLPYDKALSIDVFYIEFFKKNWPVIGQKVTAAILQFFENGS